MQHTGQKLLGGKCREAVAPGAQQSDDLLMRIIAQKINAQRKPAALRRGAARYIKGGGTGHARLGKLQLSAAGAQSLALTHEAYPAVGANALQGSRILGRGQKLNQCGAQCGRFMPQRLKKLIAVLHAAELAARCAAAGDDEMIGVYCAAVIFDLIAPLAAQYLPCDGAGAQLNARPVEGKAQHVHHGICGI